MTLVTPGPAAPVPDGGAAAAPDPQHDPRFPWKAKGTRKPLPFWDRIKFLLLFGIVFGLLAWNEYLRISPLGTFGEAALGILRSEQWLVWLAGIELVRQVHFVVAERWRGYHRLWSEKIFGRTNRWWERRFNPWNRYRIARVGKILLVVGLLSMVLGKFLDTPPPVALFQAPALLVQALPFVAQLAFAFFFIIFQFIGLFWFLSRGGIDTYFPEDIERRFSDVWGQDHVLERVKENIVLLEDPDRIEARGGHVPSGILLWGPPGTGKTLIAEAVAGETGKPYVFVDPGAFNNMFFGVGILKVKGLFRKLRKLALRYGGVIVFFDEADALGSRGQAAGGLPGRAMTPEVAHAFSCNGFGHLSPMSRTLLADAARAAEPEGPRRFVDRMIMGGAMGGGGGMGTLQALLTELSGLTKPRGFLNRVVRRTLGMRPKPPPKYRILVMMASNLPEALDPALLRPGRIDRIYRVGFPSKAGRARTYQGYLDKTNHTLSPDEVERLATMTPYATGATIKDLVNEALIYSIAAGRDAVTWVDVMKAKQLKQLGPPEDVEYIERERHAIAVHEACHAVLAWKTRRHWDIDLATIEKGQGYLGMVANVQTEDQHTEWRSHHESDILVSLASLAGERMFFEGDNSSGVSGDLENATVLAGLMESRWGMGSTISSLPALDRLKIGVGSPEPRGGEKGGGIGFGAELGARKEDPGHQHMGQRIEQNLSRLFLESEALLKEHRAQVLALAHALETHKTINGDDVVAVLEYRRGPILDGSVYADPAFAAELEAYHAAAVEAHRKHTPVSTPLPQPQPALVGQVAPVPVPPPAENGQTPALAWALGASAPVAPPPSGPPVQAPPPTNGAPSNGTSPDRPPADPAGEQPPPA